MPNDSSIAWLDAFLPLLRCPVSHGSLHLASEDERLRAALPPIGDYLCTIDLSHCYPIVDGIPHLLPHA
jgi:uncharacterized protein YbaR (Trm112 family)